MAVNFSYYIWELNPPKNKKISIALSSCAIKSDDTNYFLAILFAQIKRLEFTALFPILLWHKQCLRLTSWKSARALNSSFSFFLLQSQHLLLKVRNYRRGCFHQSLKRGGDLWIFCLIWFYCLFGCGILFVCFYTQ